MESQLVEMQQKLDALTKENVELKAFKQEYNSQVQSIQRLSTRLRKVCKRITPTSETVEILQKLADDIRDYVKK